MCNFGISLFIFIIAGLSTGTEGQDGDLNDSLFALLGAEVDASKAANNNNNNINNNNDNDAPFALLGTEVGASNVANNNNNNINNNNDNDANTNQDLTQLLEQALKNPQCHCVQAFQCVNTNVNPSPSFGSIISPKLTTCNTAQVCCPSSKLICSSIDSSTSEDICAISQECCPNKQQPRLPTTSQDDFKCGMSSFNIKIRVIHGQDAQENEFPWMVAIFDKNNKYAFAGSLIHPWFVLTVAHRVHSINRRDIGLTAQVGIVDLDQSSKQSKSIQNIYVHPEYDNKNYKNNIALLFLNSEVEMGSGVNTLCLPMKNVRNGDIPIDESTCYSGGWGKVDNEAQNHQNTLRYVKLPLVDKQSCQNSLRSTSLGQSYQLHSSMTCAGGGKEDTCEGDGGSPLFCLLNRNDRTPQYVQIGVTAWGIGCGNDIPGVYTDVNRFTSWISNMITQEFGAIAFKHFTP